MPVYVRVSRRGTHDLHLIVIRSRAIAYRISRTRIAHIAISRIDIDDHDHVHENGNVIILQAQHARKVR